jgi:hypothetical protein
LRPILTDFVRHVHDICQKSHSISPKIGQYQNPHLQEEFFAPFAKKSFSSRFVKKSRAKMLVKSTPNWIKCRGNEPTMFRLKCKLCNLGFEKSLTWLRGFDFRLKPIFLRATLTASKSYITTSKLVKSNKKIIIWHFVESTKSISISKFLFILK